MNNVNLVQKNESGKAITTSLLVAQKFNKEHKHVLDSIRDILRTVENSAVLSMFSESTYLNSQNKEQPMFVMNRDGFSLLVMGFTGKDALSFKIEFIEAFNKMESQLQKSIDSYSKKEIAQMLIESEEEKEKLQLENKQFQPKVLFADAVATSDRCCLIGELAKILCQNGVEIGQNRLFIWLRKNGFLCSGGERYNQPTQKSMDLGLFEIKQTTINKPDGTILVTVTTKVTGKGQIYFVNKFLTKDVA